MKLKVKYMDPRELKPYEKNAKEHPDWQVEQIAELILRFGFNDPVGIASDTMEIIEGHGRLLAWQSSEDIQKKYPKIPTIDLKDLTPSERKAYRLAHNKSAMNTGMIPEMEVSELSFLEKEGWDVTTLGWTDEELLKIGVRDRDETIDDEDEIPEPPENPQTKPGDIYQLGEHRLMCGDATKMSDMEMLMDLMCGDATKMSDMEMLMDGDIADMIFTDPPYNVDYGSSKNPRHKIRRIKNDAQSKEDWGKFCRDFIRNMKSVSRGDAYVWGASAPDGMLMRLILVEEGYHWSSTIIWKKQQLVLSPANYQRMYEPMFYGWHDKSSYHGGRNQTEVWEIDRPLNSKLHPTMKPVAISNRAIENSSVKGDIVLDIFGGSRSTMISCERLDRRCYMMEIEPIYCDVIIKRWENETGKKAKKIKGDPE